MILIYPDYPVYPVKKWDFLYYQDIQENGPGNGGHYAYWPWFRENSQTKH